MRQCANVQIAQGGTHQYRGPWVSGCVERIERSAAQATSGSSWRRLEAGRPPRCRCSAVPLCAIAC
eukprot:scaffold4613_cov129-Isochrysis_galbana.AAC.5